jgi:methylenetetrahydrofolate dehydrogenase (NADP+)/methenyltetrahydrofolate cyclohydrolase
MEPKFLSGREVSNSVYATLKDRITTLKSQSIIPSLAVIIVGEDPASQVYVRNKTRQFSNHGLFSDTITYRSDITQDVLLSKIYELNKNSQFHGILVQLPLPNHIDEDAIINAIDPIKDVDGFHPYNLGCLAAGKPIFIPCTPKGIMRIFHHYNITISGKHVVVVGRSNIVGRPISILTSLKQANSNGTTTICHSGTHNIGQYTKQADIIILAMGSPGYLKGDHIKEGAIVIDVGINRITDDSPKGYKLMGDGDQLSLYNKVSGITPVPGGVGPMTIAMLVENTVEAAERTQV